MNANFSSLSPEIITRDNYRRHCRYRKECYALYSKEFRNGKAEVTSVDPPSVSSPVNDHLVYRRTNKPPYAIISAEFTDNLFHEINCLYDVNGKLVDKSWLKFEGPTLSSKCDIHDLQIDENCDRQFGYIQTLKIFIERKYEKVISYSDFQSNLLNNQEEVLDICEDSSGNIPYKPFYSEESCYKLAANQSPTNNPRILKLSDRPLNSIKFKSELLTELEYKFGPLESQKRYFQFFDYFVMRSKWNGEEIWEPPVVLLSFDWFIYSYWQKETTINNNQHEYNYGVNLHAFPRHLRGFNEEYICNRDEIQYWVCFDKHLEFSMSKYPAFVSSSNEQEIFSENIKNALLNRWRQESILK